MTNDDYLDELEEGSLVMCLPAKLVKLLNREKTSEAPPEGFEGTPTQALVTKTMVDAVATTWNRPTVSNGDGRVTEHNIQWGTVGLFLGFKRIRRKRGAGRARVRAIAELNPLFFFDGMQVMLSKTELYPVDELPEWFVDAMDIPKKTK